MKFISKISRFDIAICLLSMALYVAISNAPFKAKPFGDYDFHIEAKTIAKVLWSQESYDAISITKAPGPVLFYIAPYFFAGPNATDDQYWLAGILWTGLFMTIAVFLIKAACKNFGSEQAGKIAVLLVFILPLHVYYSLGILAEGLAFFGCCVMVYGYSKVYAKNRNSSWLVFGCGVLALALARPNAVLVLPLLLVFALWETFIRKNDFFILQWSKFLVMWVMVAGVLFSVTIVVKQLPNKRQTVKQEGYLGYVALIGRYQFREETWDWRFWDDNIRPNSKDYQNWQQKMIELKTKNEVSSTDAYYDFLIHDILDHPIISIKQFLVRSLFGHTLQVSSVKKESFGIGPLRGKEFYWFFHLSLNFLNLSLLVMSILFVIRKDGFQKFGILLVPWIALVLFHGIIYMEQRYLFPIRPVMIVLSSFFMAHYFPNPLTFGKFKWNT